MTNRAEAFKNESPGFRRLAGIAAAAPPLSLIRLRIYEGLLLFIGAAALPIALVPPLRGRLVRRVWDLRQAFSPMEAGNGPARAVVGENPYEFPKELERVVAPAKGFAGGIYALPSVVFRPQGGERVEMHSARKGETAAPAADAQPAADVPAAPEFRQGALEREAYDLLLKHQETLAALVKGSNASLKFKSWAAAKGDDEGFLVDVIFVQSGGAEGPADVHYIWKVRLDSKQIEPLSHGARTLQKTP